MTRWSIWDTNVYLFAFVSAVTASIHFSSVFLGVTLFSTLICLYAIYHSKR